MRNHRLGALFFLVMGLLTAAIAIPAIVGDLLAGSPFDFGLLILTVAGAGLPLTIAYVIHGLTRPH